MAVTIKAKFKCSSEKISQVPKDDLKDIAFIGRSNVGKSSLVNMLTGVKNLAKVSGTPGKTKLINHFLINDSWYLVDLPGYGYAKASKTEAAGWQSLIEPFLQSDETLKCVCVLVDSRIEPTALDKQMIKYLYYYQIPFIIVATKTDKIAKSKVKPTLNKIANSLGVGVADIYGTSSDTGFGRVELLNKLEQFLLKEETESIE
jgi:GTP-binding protein